MPANSDDTPPNRTPRVLVAITTVAMIVMNILSNTLLFFGRGAAEVSALYPSLVTPAGYVFAIWGLIYLGMLVYSAAQFTSPLTSDPLPDRLAWPLIVANVANMAWLLLWHALAIYWTVPVMAALLVSLSVAYGIAHTDRPEHPVVLKRWAVRAPLGLYLGWISVATIDNIADALYAAGWTGWGTTAAIWAVVVLVVGSALALIALVLQGDAVFAAVFVWAFSGIAVATPSASVGVAAGAISAVVAVGIIISVALRRRVV